MSLTEWKCSKCKIVLPIGKFYVERARPNGCSRYCKSCVAANAKSHYSTQREQAKKIKYRPAILATRNLQQAIRRGIVQKEPCWFCGAKKVQGHHLLYDFPQKVVWLCSKHHSQVHKYARHPNEDGA